MRGQPYLSGARDLGIVLLVTTALLGRRPEPAPPKEELVALRAEVARLGDALVARSEEEPLTPAQPFEYVEHPHHDAAVRIAGETVPTAGLDEAQRALLASIARIPELPVEYIDGVRYVRAADRLYRDDCSNVLRIPYDAQGIDLFSEHVRYPEANGVQLIRRKGEASGALTDRPRVGDLIVFDDTYDRNGNGALDDTDTHAAIVVAVEDDGTVALYNRVRSGHKIYRMNVARKGRLRDPATGARLNDYLRKKEVEELAGTPHLTGELFSTYVRVLEAS